MWCIVGLGNPGAQYETTRHNVGFLLVDELAEELSAQWKKSAFNALSAQTDHSELGRVVFLKPQTYMNRSGDAVVPFVHYFKIDPSHLIVIHDDVDLAEGQVKARFGGGAGGQKGVDDIIKKLGNPGFHRIKIGVGRPQDAGDLSSWVLGRLSDQQLIALQNEVLDAVKLRLRQIYQQQAS